jgi:ABC-2 type transport system permease protein
MNAVLTRDPMTSSQVAVPAGSPIPFGRLLRVEWGKATDTRAARWLIAVSGAVTVLIMLVPLLAKGSIDQTERNYFEFATLALTALLPVVSILTLTTEWTQRTVLTTFTQEPRRGRVIGAKVAVSGIMAGLAAVFGGLVAFGAIALADATGRGLVADVHGAQVAGFVVFVLLNMMMGVAFGALLHNTAASIVLFFIIPTLFGLLGAALKSVGHWIDPATTWDWVQHGQWSGHAPQIMVATAIWVVVPLWAGLIRTARREIK